jgi:hypothetical protein
LGSVHGALGFKLAITRIALFELPSRADKLNAAIAQLNPLADDVPRDPCSRHAWF